MSEPISTPFYDNNQWLSLVILYFIFDYSKQHMQVHELLDLDYANIEDTAELKTIIQVYNLHLDIKYLGLNSG